MLVNLIPVNDMIVQVLGQHNGAGQQSLPSQSRQRIGLVEY